MIQNSDANAVILSAGIIGLLFAIFLLRQVASISLGEQTGSSGKLLAWYANIPDGPACQKKMDKAVSEGAAAFLFAEYRICAIFIVVFGTVVFILTSYTIEGDKAAWKWDHGFY